MYVNSGYVMYIKIVSKYRIHSLKYLRYATFGSKDIVIRKSEFVAKTQFLSDLYIRIKTKLVKEAELRV